MNTAPQNIDPLLYIEKIAEGLDEFPTECPEWCVDRHLLAHRVPDDHDDTRVHERRFGDSVRVVCIERLEQPGRLDGWVASVESGDLTADQLHGLARSAAAAARWLEALQ